MVRLYRALLVAYPPAFRARFGAELALAFSEGLIAARRSGRRHALAFIWSRCADAIISGISERLARVPALPAPGRETLIMRFLFDLRTALRQLSRQRSFAAVLATSKRWPVSR